MAPDILQAAANALAQVNIDVALVGGATMLVNDCLGLKASAGEFTLRLGRPTFQITPGGIELVFVIDEISMHALQFRMKPRIPTFSDPNPCHWSGKFGIGGEARNVRVTMTCSPIIRVDECHLASLGSVSFRLSIGSFNLDSVPHDLDNLAKNLIEDAITSGVNAFLPGQVEGALGGVISGSLCSDRIAIYKAYMAVLGAGVTMHAIPQVYIDKLQAFYPDVDLHAIKFGFSDRQPPGNATTDCNRIYFSNPDFVAALRDGALLLDDPYGWSWLFHELQHTQQCVELGGRDNYAERWFRDLAISALLLNLAHPESFFADLHDRMPMEEDADARMRSIVIVAGNAQDPAGPLASAEMTVFEAGSTVTASTPPVAKGLSSPDGLAYASRGDYSMFVEAGTYDVYVRPQGAAQRGLAAAGVTVEALDSDGDGITEVHYLDIDLTSAPSPVSSAAFRRGDSNGSGDVNISDALHTLSWLFSDGAVPPCRKAADVNDDGRVDISDPLALLGYLFLGSAEPPAPFGTRGTDPTPDALTCSGV